MKEKWQLKSDERDNRRVFRWSIAAVIVVLLGALAYNFLAQTAEEGPIDQGSTFTAPGEVTSSKPARSDPTPGIRTP